MSDKAFLGTGMKFPPQINRATGRVMTSQAEESVKESVYLILMTQLTERFLRPDFGSDLMQYTFMDINLTNMSMLQRTITNTLLVQEPRISDVEIGIDDSDVQNGRLLINIDYVLQNTNVRDNLVFPFYLNAAVEEEEYEPEQVEELPEFED